MQMKDALTRSVVALVALVCISAAAWANDIAVTSVTRLGGRLTGGFSMVRFTVAWTNSWRCDLAGAGQAAPYNYDAAWVFVKWRTNSASGTGAWNHASLSTNAADHVAPAGSTISVGVTTNKGVGVFLYRSANGDGLFTANKTSLRWNYTADGVADGAPPLELKVCAIEMAYVPQGAFKVGDGNSAAGQFCEGGGSTPFSIASENAISVTNQAGSLWAPASCVTGSISADFPKGYAAFYGMKHEFSQGQYVDFLNTLTYTQATSRWYKIAIPASRYAVTNVSGVYTSSLPYVPCGRISWSDIAAYLDWAGLRPMTELEFEKACRGTNAPVLSELAWGDTANTMVTGIINNGLANEAPVNATGNCTWNNQTGGPMRVGCLGMNYGTRLRTGAGYYGMMELSGNLFESCVSAGNVEGRSFTGLHGDGTLDGSGKADVTGWPVNTTCLRGGTWYVYSGQAELPVSARTYGATSSNSREAEWGARGVRTAP